MVARNSLLSSIHLVQPHVQLRQLVDLAVEIHVGLPQFLLDGDQRPQHAVESRGQLLELVAGVDLGPQGDIAAGHGVAHVAEVPQRFDDHVADDGIRGEHAEKDRDDGAGPEDGRVGVQLLLRGSVWEWSLWRSP